MDRAILILSAIIANALLAGPRRFYARFRLPPVLQMPAMTLRTLERKLNRENRSLQQRRLRGIILVMVVVIASIALGVMLERVFRYYFGFLELVILAVMLPVRPTWDCASDIYKALKANDLPAARKVLEGTLWRHHAVLDAHGVARAGIEMLSVHFSEKILAPAFWYVFLGLPGFFASKSIYLLKETLVRPAAMTQEGDSGFGRAAYVAHFLFHFLTSRTAALLWLAAMAFLPSSRPLDATQQVIGGDVDMGSPEYVALLSTAAVLNISLGGPTSVYIGDQWLGSGRAKATAPDIRNALYLFALLHLFIIILFGVFL